MPDEVTGAAPPPLVREAAQAAELHRWFLATARAFSPPLAEAMAAVGPLWFPERPDLGLPVFLARAVVGQQLSTKAARSIWARVEATAAAAGASVPELFHEAHSERLRGCGLSAGKVKALCSIGATAQRGRLESALVRALAHPERCAHLREIHGVGQWTCDMVSLFYCRDRDVWPAGDGGVQRAFKLYLGRRSPERAAARFAPYRSILALYLWRVLDAVPVTASPSPSPAKAAPGG